MIARALHEALADAPERLALESVERTWTAAELDLAARRWAHRLAGRRRVGLLADNGLELAAAFIGALYAGAAVVPFHAGTPLVELEERVRRFGVDVIVSDRALGGLAIEVVGIGDHGASAVLEPVVVDADAPALLLGTSGTTGEPRAVVVDHGSFATHAANIARALGLGPDDRVLGALPLAHSYGCRMALVAPLLAGASVHLVARFSAHGSLALMAERAITWAPAVPTMLSAWGALEGPPPGALRWVLSAGAPLPEAIRLRAEARLGCAVREGYGLTEASFSTLDAPPAPAAPGTVGRPTPGVELRLDEATHEVQVQGPNVMRGYLDDPEGTAQAFTADGWLRTGDVGQWRQGCLVIVDRIKDIILRGGHTVYPAEVEAALAHHPAIAAVAVVGRPHPHLGEEVVAHVVRRAPIDEAGLSAWLIARLASYKVPAAFVWETELPLGASGKVLKRRLRAGHRLC